jgi:hypothetical protein
MDSETSEARESINRVVSAVCDCARHLGDMSYAILPRELAHSMGDLKKSFLNVVRTAVDKEIEWIDERVAGGDRLRDEWRRSYEADKSGAGEPIN